MARKTRRQSDAISLSALSVSLSYSYLAKAQELQLWNPGDRYIAIYIQAGSHKKKPAIRSCLQEECIDLIIRFIFMVVPTAPHGGMDKQATYKIQR